ncbi:MAG: hypothetical protein ACR2QZ_13170, partial [Woeseiaceae bacterium]
MPKSREMPAGSAGREIAGQRVSPRRIGAVESADLSNLYSAFESFLVELSAACTQVEPDHLESETVRWLDRLAALMGAELCTIAEYRASDGKPSALLEWTVGDQPASVLINPDSWVQA